MADVYGWIYYYLTYTDQTAFAAALALNGGSPQVQLAPANAAPLFPGAAITTPWPYGASGPITDPTSNLALLPIGQPNGPPGGQVAYTPSLLSCGLNQQAVVIDWYASQDGPPTPSQRIYIWVGFITLAQAHSTPAPPSPTQPPPPSGTVYIGHRRWIEGFEVPPGGAGGTGSVAFSISRDASRTADGFGFAYRDIGPTNTVSHATPSPHPVESWERIYVRLRALPSAEQNWWSCYGSGQSGAALVATIDATGYLRVYNLGNGTYPGTQVWIAGPLTVGTWSRLDLHFRFFDGTTGAFFGLFIDGAGGEIVTSVTGSQGLAVNQLHASSVIGATAGGTRLGLELDADDWISAQPTELGPYVGLDLNSGSHVVAVRWYPTCTTTRRPVARCSPGPGVPVGLAPRNGPSPAPSGAGASDACTGGW